MLSTNKDALARPADATNDLEISNPLAEPAHRLTSTHQNAKINTKRDIRQI